MGWKILAFIGGSILGSWAMNVVTRGRVVTATHEVFGLAAGGKP